MLQRNSVGIVEVPWADTGDGSPGKGAGIPYSKFHYSGGWGFMAKIEGNLE